MMGSLKRGDPTSRHVSPRLTQVYLQRVDFALQVELAPPLSPAASPG